MQRFKEALTTGNWKDNPEGLVRDDNGKYVLYDDHIAKVKRLEAEVERLREENKRLEQWLHSICPDDVE